MYMYVYVYVYVCICIHTHLYTHTCGCTYALVWAHFVNLYCLISLLHARVSQVFLNTRSPACVCVGGLEVGVVSACSLLALVAGVGGYVLTGVLSCKFLYLCGC